MARIQTGSLKRLARLRRQREKEKGGHTFARPVSAYRFDASLRITGVGPYHDEILVKNGHCPDQGAEEG